MNEYNSKFQDKRWSKYSSVRTSTKLLNQQNFSTANRPLNKNSIYPINDRVQIVVNKFSSINPSLLNECSGRSSALFRGACQTSMASYNRDASQSKKENNWIHNCAQAIAKELNGGDKKINKPGIKRTKRYPLIPIKIENARVDPIRSVKYKKEDINKSMIVKNSIRQDLGLMKNGVSFHKGVSESTKNIKQAELNYYIKSNEGARTFYSLRHSIPRSMNKSNARSNKKIFIIDNTIPAINQKEVKPRCSLVNKEAFNDYANGIILNQIYH